MLSKIKQMAQAKGYSGVEALGKWKGFDVYEAFYSGWFGKHGDTRLGLLVKGDDVRWTSASEFRDILRDLG